MTFACVECCAVHSSANVEATANLRCHWVVMCILCAFLFHLVYTQALAVLSCMAGVIHDSQVHSSAMPLLGGHLLHVEMIKLKPETECEGV